ncbi:ankyrin-3-like isoform X4 [Onthophagus taurus]|uniref:ankyrin-3-like isoform X4 n=1 Tax=Onthophagus taurus TaxID=166361 RepID=UPI0039BEB254
MALGNGSATTNGGVTQEKAPVVNGTAMETLPRTGKQTDPNTAFLRAARAGQLDKIQEYLDSGTVRDINTSNANGLNALHLAAKDGHVDVAKELLKRGAIVDAATKKGNTALHIASLAGQEEIVRLLIQHSASINVQSQNGFTPLYMAAQENHDSCVKYLLSKGANQSLATEDGFTPLAVAMQQGHDKVVAVLLESDTRGKVKLPALHIAAKKDDCKAASLLLQNDHNPDVTSKSGFTPLHIAAHYGNDKVASLLYEKGADVNYSAKHNITPLHVASKWGKMNMVTLLVAKGADIQAKTRDGLTPLHCAARSGHDQVVDMLLENGAPMHAKTKNGLAPLHMAAQGEHVDAARILLFHGAPVDEVTMDYLTALHVAAHCGHVRVAKLLLERGADPNARALNGFTPLHIACKKSRNKMVELLLKHGASISATTESGLTPLHVASFMGCMNIVIFLLQHDASPDIPTVRGETPLHLAARANQTDIIRILLRNGAVVDARAREEQTPLHVASRLGNVDIVMLLLQHGAQPHATTKDLYTPLHIAAKEGQEEVASVLLDHGADLTATTKKGLTPLHLAAKYGHLNVARLLLQRDAPADAQGKNGVTPLHVAAHYDHQPVALLLLDKGASPHATAKNGHTPLHIAAKKNQMDIATTLLEYGAKADAESKAGFTPLHLSCQEGHSDMSSLLLEHQAGPNREAKNGLTPLHLCAQEDRVPVAQLLLRAGALKDSRTKSGYTPLHIACHQGHVNMVRLLIEQGAEVNPVTQSGYTPLHQAAQQGHVLVINLLLKNKANPNVVTYNGQTALGIANKLGYISVVEELKVVTELDIITTTTINIEEKYKVVAPEGMQETFMSDSEDEGGGLDEPPVAYGRPPHVQYVYLPYYQGQMTYTREDPILGDQQQYKYMSGGDDMKSFGDDSRMDVTNDEKSEYRHSMAPSHISGDALITSTQVKDYYAPNAYLPDNVDINRQPITVGLSSWKNFLVSFLVDARGGAMRGCRHSGVRVIVPPRCAASPTRITCRYVRPKKIQHPPPLMEGEALASRVLELGPVGAKFLGPVILEVPHFASLRGKQREIVVLRSENGETWKEHTLEANEEAVQDVLNHSFEGEELNQIEDLHTNRITRILTNDFPHYFAVVSRVRQDVYAIGPDGGTVSSTAVPLVQAVFPQNALTKKIRVGLQAQAIESETVSKLLGHGVAVSPIVTVEPRRRKFHKAITLSLPAPKAHTQGMINQYSGFASTLRLLCSITGGQNKAVWEDVTGSTPLSFVKECVSFTTTVSARFWLMDCRNFSDSARMATELYNQATHVPFMAKFVIFAKRVSGYEARVRVFCMTDDKEDKTLEQQEQFTEIAKSKDIEVLEDKDVFMEFGGNLVPVLQSGDQPKLGFKAFKENRVAFTMRLRDPDEDPNGRIVFMNDPKVARGEPTQTPICTLNLSLPKDVLPDRDSQSDLLSLDKDHSYLHHGGISHPETIHRADFRLTDICNLLEKDWELLASELDIPPSDIALIKEQYPENNSQQAMIMFRLWLRQKANKATGNSLELALHKIGRSDIVDKCICNVELVTDDMEKALAKVRLDQSGFDSLKDELGSSRDASLKRDVTLKIFNQDEIDISDKNDISDRDLTDTISECLTYNQKKENEIIDSNLNEDIPKIKTEILEGVVEHFNKLDMSPIAKERVSMNTPPPSPADLKIENAQVFQQQETQPSVNGELNPPTSTSTPTKHFIPQEDEVINEINEKIVEVEINEEPKALILEEEKVIIHQEIDPIEKLKQNVNDTLTFLHSERNDFLPDEDIIIPSRKDDHVSQDINLDMIKKLDKKSNLRLDLDVDNNEMIVNNVRTIVLNEITDVIKELDVDEEELRQEVEPQVNEVIREAEDVVNDLKTTGKDYIMYSTDTLSSNEDFDLPQKSNDLEEKNWAERNANWNESTSEQVTGSSNNWTHTPDEKINFWTETIEQLDEEIESVDEDVKEQQQNELEKLANVLLETKSELEEIKNQLKELPENVQPQKTKDSSQNLYENIPFNIKEETKNFVEKEMNYAEVTKKNLRPTVEIPKKIEETSLNDSLTKAQEEAFKFLETEISSPLTPSPRDPPKSVSFTPDSPSKSTTVTTIITGTPKSSIPIAKPRQSKEFVEERVSSPTESEILSKIPVCASNSKGKVKTIKKHSKDPLKEFVKLTQDVNWDEENVVIKSADPIVKTTVTRIITEHSPNQVEKISQFEKDKSKIPVYHTVTETITRECSSENNSTVKGNSKIPVLVSETTKILSPEEKMSLISSQKFPSVESSLVSPGSDKTKTSKGSTIDSDSDTDSRRSPPLKGILKKSSIRTVGSSSGSDIALHEGGAELSDDDSEDFYQHDPQFYETTTEEIDPITGARTTIRTVTHSYTISPETRTMQNVLNHFMAQERNFQ